MQASCRVRKVRFWSRLYAFVTAAPRSCGNIWQGSVTDAGPAARGGAGRFLSAEPIAARAAQGAGRCTTALTNRCLPGRPACCRGTLRFFSRHAPAVTSRSPVGACLADRLAADLPVRRDAVGDLADGRADERAARHGDPGAASPRRGGAGGIGRRTGGLGGSAAAVLARRAAGARAIGIVPAGPDCRAGTAAPWATTRRLGQRLSAGPPRGHGARYRAAAREGAVRSAAQAAPAGAARRAGRLGAVGAGAGPALDRRRRADRRERTGALRPGRAHGRTRLAEAEQHRPAAGRRQGGGVRRAGPAARRLDGHRAARGHPAPGRGG